MSGTAERICAKLIRNTCLVPRLRSLKGKVKVTEAKNGIFGPFGTACVQFMFGETSLASSF